MIFSAPFAQADGQARTPDYFSLLPNDLKTEILIKNSIDDLARMANLHSSRDYLKLIKSPIFYKTWMDAKKNSPRDQVLFPMFLAIGDLRKALKTSWQSKLSRVLFSKPGLSDRFRKYWVSKLLNPKTQFGEIPQGKFLMGASYIEGKANYDSDAHPNESPVWVELKKENIRIKIQRTGMTQLLWYLVMKSNPSHFKLKLDCPEDHIVVGGVQLCPRHPVDSVSFDVIAEKDETDNQYKEGTFLRTLKDEFGIGARLPTEAERERATRGRDVIDPDGNPIYQPYYFGDAGDQNGSLSAHVWWRENSSYTRVLLVDSEADARKSLSPNLIVIRQRKSRITQFWNRAQNCLKNEQKDRIQFRAYWVEKGKIKKQSVEKDYAEVLADIFQNGITEVTDAEMIDEVEGLLRMPRGAGLHTHRVGAEGHWNNLGLADMAGNLMEWVEDKARYGVNPYPSVYPDRSPITRDNPLVNPAGTARVNVIFDAFFPAFSRGMKGSSYRNGIPVTHRTSSRGCYPSKLASRDTGFRVVIEVQVSQEAN